MEILGYIRIGKPRLVPGDIPSGIWEVRGMDGSVLTYVRAHCDLAAGEAARGNPDVELSHLVHGAIGVRQLGFMEMLRILDEPAD